MFNYAKRKVDVEAWPIEMLIVPQLDFTYLLDGCVFEPWKMLKRQKIFLALEEHPKTVFRNVRNLRLQSVFATL